MALQITDANFEELLGTGKPMVLDFWAEWCGPCRMVSPINDELAQEYEGRVTIGKINVDENDDVVGRFGIRNIPTVIFFKNGEMVDKIVGATSKDKFKEKVENRYIFEDIIRQTNKNGLVVLYKNLIRIFIPISLSEVGRDEDINTYKGKTIRFRVIENDERAKKIIGSVKDVVEEEKKEKEETLWNSIEVNKKYKGIVTSISDYGAFVDIGGAQGLLHISEMAWGRNQNPRDILQVGQEIEVKVKELDRENRRFKLSYEKRGPNPWNKVEEKYHVGDVVKVKISKLMPFGAFAELEKGIEGLVHISQICERKIVKPEEELKVGQKVNAKIIDIDLENKKIELSIRELEGTSQEYKEE